MFKRRIVLGGIASATILASGVFMAGTSQASILPQVPSTVPFNAGTLIPTGPMAQVPGVLGALKAAPAPVTGTRNKITTSNLSGVPSTNKVATPLHGTSGITKTAQGAASSSALSGLSNGSGPVTANLPVVGSLGQSAGAASGTLSKVTPQVPIIGNLTGGAPGAGQAAGVLGGA